ncbi:acyltransferase family protein [Microbacterium sp. A84]|uniref:acyltransferase family protein n=1 Tax=Microbacterium sp. A84 TaxID=3450715 RepID=UPI003F43F289
MSAHPHATVTKHTKRTSFRRDIQGLRAVAVIAVILNHAVGEPSGGFLGVDVFFVISGFIITALLLREVDRTGRISFITFYKRRVKRILPAATLILAVTVALSYLLIGGERARQIAGDALAATFFVSNWRFAITGTDYWADDGTTSPLQHYWSLGVEEQFYVIWPLIIAVVAFALYQRRALKLALGVMLALITVGSLVWAAHQVDTVPMWAYFSTLTRAWELGVGALLALAATQLARIPEALRPYLAWVGIVGLAYSLMAVTETDGMPVPGALVAVAATALIIGAGTGAESEASVWPLSNRASSYVGDISYSLYLWHLPVIVFIGPYFEHHERRFLLAVLAVTLVLSVATYHLIEDPIRHSHWLEKGSDRKSNLYTIAATVVVMTLVATTSVIVLRPAAAADASPSASMVPITPQTQEELTKLLSSALAADDWPTLVVSPGDVAELGRVDERTGCSPSDLSNLDTCWFPNEGAGRTALVMGDSTAITLIPTVRSALGDAWNVRGTTMQSCPQIELVMHFDTQERADSCAAHQSAALDVVAETKPDVVFIQNVYSHVQKISSKAPPDKGGAAEWALATFKLVQEVQKYAGVVVLVQSPPKGPVLSDCAKPGSTPSACTAGLELAYHQVAEADRAVARATGATYVRTEDWYCVDGACPGFVGNVPVKLDNIHTTKHFAELLGSILRAKLTNVI